MLHLVSHLCYPVAHLHLRCSSPQSPLAKTPSLLLLLENSLSWPYRTCSHGYLLPTQKFLQAQRKVGVITRGLPLWLFHSTCFWLWLFIYEFDWGITGAAVAFDPHRLANCSSSAACDALPGDLYMMISLSSPDILITPSSRLVPLPSGQSPVVTWDHISTFVCANELGLGHPEAAKHHFRSMYRISVPCDRTDLHGCCAGSQRTTSPTSSRAAR
ncbi:hypothetical protein OIU85_022635 [Salix viminalis]|uniref:Uncharacterized protein n=1 Tax=Salix viminalis TaxID=40686 RepID=A0A9Q0Z818_SALVM|nr:hypothetical protein OIU85_022635 [Salix viminalis]